MSQLVFAGLVHATKKDRNRTESDRQLQLCTFQIKRPQLLNWMQLVFDTTCFLKGTPSKYLPNESKNVENDQDLNKLLNSILLKFTKFPT
jgi:hypothetical protein